MAVLQRTRTRGQLAADRRRRSVSGLGDTHPERNASRDRSQLVAHVTRTCARKEVVCNVPEHRNRMFLLTTISLINLLATDENRERHPICGTL